MRVLRRVFRTKRGCNSRLEKTASFHHLYSLAMNTRLIKSKGTKWAGHITHIAR
jgi:hypothetical protein